MKKADIKAVTELLQKFLAKYDMAPVYNAQEIEHWMYHTDKPGQDRVVWTYVVEVRVAPWYREAKLTPL